MRITVSNPSLPYKDTYLKDLCCSLAKKAKIQRDVHVDFYERSYTKNTDGKGTLIGFAYINWDPFWVDCFIDQKLNYPYIMRNKYTLYTINRTVLYSQEDLIKYIIAHEFCHATYGHRDNFRLPMGGTDRHAMELCCDSFALAATGIRN